MAFAFQAGADELRQVMSSLKGMISQKNHGIQ